MIIPLVDLFDSHLLLLGRFKRFSPSIVSFLKFIADNAAFHHSPTYRYPLDEDYIERFAARHSDIELDRLHRITRTIRKKVESAFAEHTDIDTQYFDIRCDGGILFLDFTPPPKPKKELSLNYDVPWGTPPGTIKLKHLDVIPSGLVKYVWCDDSEECDVVIGETIHIIDHGLWELVDDKLHKRDLQDYIDTPKPPPEAYNICIAPPKYRIPSSRPMRVTPNIELMDGKPTLMVYGDGDFSEEYIGYVFATFGKSPKSKKEYDVVINGIEFLIDKAGLYKFDDGELVSVD